MEKLFVTTSWDDGHVLDLKVAELLKKYGIKGTFYIAPRNREVPVADRLTDAQIQELSKDFEIGAHTMTHPNLKNLSDTEAEREIRDSKTYLEQVTGGPVKSFCYPSGYYTERHVQIVVRAGFSVARTVGRFSLSYPTDLFQVCTSVHAYNHWSDIWQIALFAHFHPRLFWKYYRNWDDLAIAMFELVKQTGGVFHLWGHSWEIEKNKDWKRLEKVLLHTGQVTELKHINNSNLI